MTGLLDYGIRIVLSFQNLGNWLLGPMLGFTFLGNEEFFLFLAPILFWCVDTRLGVRVGLFLMISGGINDVLKFALHGPRPFWFDPRVQALSIETTFGIPSGHSQNAVVVWGTIAKMTRRKWMSWLAILLILLIGLSRIYLGVHFPTDVLAGWLIGAALLWAFMTLEKPIVRIMKDWTLLAKLLAFLALSLIFILSGWLVRVSIAEWQMPQEWIINAARATGSHELMDPTEVSGLFSKAGAFFGLAGGIVLLQKYGGFDARGQPIKLVARYCLGLFGVLILWRGLALVFPDGETLVAYVLRFIRYTLVGLWVTAAAPLLFVRLRLADFKFGLRS